MQKLLGKGKASKAHLSTENVKNQMKKAKKACRKR